MKFIIFKYVNLRFCYSTYIRKYMYIMSLFNIIFYSNNCEASRLLLSMIQSEKLTPYFYMYCTDTNPVPTQIKVTPTLIIKGVPTPYVAKDAFAWLAKIKQWKIIVMMQRMNNAQQNYFESINNNLKLNDNNLLGFSQSEMNGMSDIFSFFSTEWSRDNNSECQDALPQSYFLCENIGKEFIDTKPLEDGTYRISDNNKIKISKEKQKDMLNKLKSERKQQDEIFKQNIEKFMNSESNN